MTGATLDAAVEATDALAGVPAQPAAVAELRAALSRPVHAYLLVGPRGSGKRAAARAFAAELLARGSSGEEAARHRRLALAETHPDLEVVEREGASISRDQARRIVEQSVRSPVEGAHKVLVLTEFHLVLDAAPILLKAIEEPPASTVFLILAEEIPPELVTIASRCVVVRFAALTQAEVVARLVAEGVPAATAERAAEAAGGDVTRARILTSDPGLEERVATWRALPDRLDGTGAAVAALVDELTGQLDRALAPMDARHRAELDELAARAERYGMTRTGQRVVEERHRRERRRFRTDELRFGLGVLARSWRDRVVAGLTVEPSVAATSSAASGATAAASAAATTASAAATTATGRRTVSGTAGGPTDRAGAGSLAAFDAIASAVEGLERNPNETLLLQALLIKLRPLS